MNRQHERTKEEKIENAPLVLPCGVPQTCRAYGVLLVAHERPLGEELYEDRGQSATRGLLRRRRGHEHAVGEVVAPRTDDNL